MRALLAFLCSGLALLGAVEPARAANDILSIIRKDFERRQQRTIYQRDIPRVPRQRPRPRLPRPSQPPPSLPADGTSPSQFTLQSQTDVQQKPVAVSILGDQLADALADALTEQFGTHTGLALSARTRPGWGVVRGDWSEAVAERLALPEPVEVAVILVGANDSYPIEDGGQAVPPDRPEWRALYAKKVDALLDQFKAKAIQVFWVSLPPMRERDLNATAALLNDIYRERVQRAGGLYIDIWAAFADEDGGYKETGPDLNGQPRKLRMADGIRFTKAGANLAAHYVNKELRRALLSPDDPNLALPRSANPLAAVGAIHRLNGVDPSPGGLLLGATQPPPGSAAPPSNAPEPAKPSVATTVFVQGGPLSPQPGRADDYRWPLP